MVGRHHRASGERREGDAALQHGREPADQCDLRRPRQRHPVHEPGVDQHAAEAAAPAADPRRHDRRIVFDIDFLHDAVEDEHAVSTGPNAEADLLEFGCDPNRLREGRVRIAPHVDDPISADMLTPGVEHERVERGDAKRIVNQFRFAQIGQHRDVVADMAFRTNRRECADDADDDEGESEPSPAAAIACCTGLQIQHTVQYTISSKQSYIVACS